MSKVETGRSNVVWLCTTLALCGACAEAQPSEDASTWPMDANELEADAGSAPTTDSGPAVPSALDGEAQDASLDAPSTDAQLDASALVDASTQHVNACAIDDRKAHCKAQNIETLGASSDLRKIYWAAPSLPAPSSGHPVVLLYQGSFFGPSVTWNVDVAKNTPFGGYHQVQVVAELLERGYVVIQPEAQGSTFWSTNLGGDFTKSVDGVFIPILLEEMRRGRFGKLDLSRLYATGMSSGGYMASRMAVSFSGQFRALAVHSAAYATCAGPLCFIPAELPATHPPTLLLHGAADLTVPISTARDYESKLKASGVQTKFVEDPTAGHQWLSSAAVEIADWFDQH